MAPDSDSAPIREGDAAPAFTLLDHEGKSFSSAALAGKPYVLFFYPKADTPGCTVESCGFRDEASAFHARGVTVLGASPDSPKAQDAFRTKYGFPYRLLSDPDHHLVGAYGSWVKKIRHGQESMGLDRSTFLVGKDGRVVKAWRGVKVDGHVAEVLTEAGRLV